MAPHTSPPPSLIEIIEHESFMRSDRLKEDNARLKEEVAQVDEAIARLKEEIARLKEKVAKADKRKRFKTELRILITKSSVQYK